MNRLQWLAAILLLCMATPICAQQDKSPSNDTLFAARAANKDKRYADAEALMLKATSAQPELLYPWVELGIAQKA